MELIRYNNTKEILNISEPSEDEIIKIVGKRLCVNKTLIYSEKENKAYLVPTSTWYMSEEQGLSLEEMYVKYPLNIQKIN